MRHDMSCVELPDRENDPDPVILNSRTLTARKPHKCDGCRIGINGEQGEIKKGEAYQQVVTLDDGFTIKRFCFYWRSRSCPSGVVQEHPAVIALSGDIPF